MLLTTIIVLIIIICFIFAYSRSCDARETLCSCARYENALRGWDPQGSHPPCNPRFSGKSPFESGPCVYPGLNPFFAPYGTIAPDSNNYPIMRSLADDVAPE